MFARKQVDNHIGELLALHYELIEATKAWSKGAEINPSIIKIRHRAIQLNHLRYIDLIPAYSDLAQSFDLAKAVELDEIVNTLMITGEAFKSYDAAWLKNADFPAMTSWLESLYSSPIVLESESINSLAEWKLQLRKQGVFLMYSSGTSGRISFIARDPMTWKYLRTISISYANDQFRPGNEGNQFDCLVLGAEGDGLGIQGAASGLVKFSQRSHYLYSAVSGHLAFDVGAFNPDLNADYAQRCYQNAIAFLQQAIELQHPVLIFGAPFQLARFCEQVTAACGSLKLLTGSIIVTGGGWKTFQGVKLARKDLYQRVLEALCVPDDAIIDAYGSTEINCTLLSCSQHRYHIPPLIEPVVLDYSLMGSVGAQGFGTLGFLDPFALSYPGFIITGDKAKLLHGKCECGLHGWYISGEIERDQKLEVKGCGGIMASMHA